MAAKTFNQSSLRFFDKSGTELMLNYTSTIKIDVINEDFSSGGVSYLLIPGGSGGFENSSVLRTKDGSRFKLHPSYTVSVKVGDNDPIQTRIPSSHFNITQYSSNKGYTDVNGNTIGVMESYIDLKYNEYSDFDKKSFLNLIGIDPYSNLSPDMASFEANLVFEKVSTELVETQSIFVLSETEDEYENVFGIHGIVDVSTNATGNTPTRLFMEEYNMFFFIDCRDQKDFRFFTVDGDSVVWSDRHIVDFSNGKLPIPDNGFRVDIGFRGELEGVYDQKMYVCLMNKSTSEVTVIGTINMTAETEGEDERYRTFFTNFGLPSIEEVDAAFRDSDINDDYPDYISRNRHAKKMFLAYSDIFPYAGSYKALTNAIKFLGYNDVFFKEWYKDLTAQTQEDDGYVAYDVSFKSNPKLNTINTKPVEERIHLRKMNWISMMYKLNEEVEGPVDRWGFPITETNINYYNTGNLMKLMSLKDWIDKYVVGVNCKITDVGGEGIVFERYNLYKYGQIQQVFDYTNEKQLSIKVNKETETLIDGSANISVDINTSNSFERFEDFKGKSFFDFVEGYFDSNGTYDDNQLKEETLDFSRTIAFGKTFELDNHMDSFELRTRGKFNTFKLNNDEYIYKRYPQIIIDDDRIFFDPKDTTKKIKNSVFKTLPIIKIKEGCIKRYVNSDYNKGILSNIVKITPKGSYTVIENIDHENSNNFDTSVNGELILIPPDTSMNGDYIYYSMENLSGFTLRNRRNKKGQFDIYTANVYSRSDVSFDNTTYGLRFTNDTFDGTPSFMIAGYTTPQFNTRLGKLFPLQNETQDGDVNEFYIDILNGSMLFPDTVNDRMVSVNFDYDSKTRKINITAFNSVSRLNTYEYKISNSQTVNRFRAKENYSYFASGYKRNAESVVFNNKTKTINVLNTGRYDLDVIISDEYNNLFCAKATKSVNVVTPEIDTSLYTHDSSFISINKNTGTPISQENIQKTRNITNDEGNMCIYEYTPKKKILKKDGVRFVTEESKGKFTSSKINLQSEYFKNQTTFLYSQLNNLSDRFVLVSRYRYPSQNGSKIFAFIKRSCIYEKLGFVSMDDFNDLTNATHLQPDVSLGGSQTYYIDRILSEYDSVSKPNKNNCIGTLANVNVVLYDDSREYPILSYPAVCIPVKNFANGDGEYAGKVDFYEYRVIFDYTLSQDDIDYFENCILENPNVSIYMIPAWTLECRLTSGIKTTVKGYKNLKYPFSKPLVVYDNYKIMFGDSNDIPDSPYNDSSYWNDNSDAGYGPIKTNNPKGFGQFDFHLEEQQSKGTEDSSWGPVITMDCSVNEKYIDTDVVRMFVSHSNKEYSEFILKNDTEKMDYQNGEITMEDTAVNRELSYYIDTTYSVSFRNFNVRNGITYWDDDINSGLPYLYSYRKPVITTNSKVMVAPVLSQEFTHRDDLDILINNECTISWKIYKQKNNYTHELLFECFNEILTLDLKEEGTYDIDMTIYDKHGNKFTRELIGAITIK